MSRLPGSALTLTAMRSPIPCTPCVRLIIGDSPGKPAVNTTGTPPNVRSAGPRLTLETTVLPVNVGPRRLGSNWRTPHRSSGAGTAANAAEAASTAGCPRRRCWPSSGQCASCTYGGLRARMKSDTNVSEVVVSQRFAARQRNLGAEIGHRISACGAIAGDGSGNPDHGGNRHGGAFQPIDAPPLF